MRTFAIVLALAFGALVAAPALVPGADAVVPPVPLVKAVTVHGGLNVPVAVQWTPDGRLVFAEWQTGNVRVIENGVVSAPVIHVPVVTGFELGLTEMSLHPDYANKPFVYVFYTFGVQSGWGSSGHWGRLSRFMEVAHNQFGPEEILLDYMDAGVAHNDGIIAWGGDGKLYLSHGDVTRYAVAQEINGWNGRILRLNEDGTIPADNPMGANNPTWSYGHRAPYGMDFHPVTHDLWITENMDNVKDEINIALPGRNYGWPNVAGCTTQSKYTNPLIVHSRTIGPTNGVFYRGTGVPSLTGHFYYGDTNNGRLYQVVARAPLFQRAVQETVVIDDASSILDVVNGPDGYLYYTTFGAIKRVQGAAPYAPASVLPDAPYVTPLDLEPDFRNPRNTAWDAEPGLCLTYA